MNEYIAVQSDGRLRRLARVEQRDNGDLLISLFGGSNNGGPEHDLIKENHISVHRSLDSKFNRNGVKTTIRSNKAPLVQKYAYTTSIKLKEGFWNIATCRFTRLADSYFDMREDQKAVQLPINYDETKMTLVVGFAVSGANDEFDYDQEEVAFISIKFTHFNLVILYSLIPVPAIDYGKLLVPLTIDPLRRPAGMSYERAISLVRGVPARESVDRFLVTVYVMYAEYLNRLGMLSNTVAHEAERNSIRQILQQLSYYFFTSVQDRFRESNDVWIDMFRPKHSYAPAWHRSLRVIDMVNGNVLHNEEVRGYTVLITKSDYLDALTANLCFGVRTRRFARPVE